MFEFTHWNETFKGHIVKHQYGNGRLAVQLFTVEGQYATLSVNVPDAPLNEGEFIFKTYSENQGLFEEMLQLEGVEPTEEFLPVGYEICPVCVLNKNAGA